MFTRLVIENGLCSHFQFMLFCVCIKYNNLIILLNRISLIYENYKPLVTCLYVSLSLALYVCCLIFRFSTVYFRLKKTDNANPLPFTITIGVPISLSLYTVGDFLFFVCVSICASMCDVNCVLYLE